MLLSRTFPSGFVPRQARLRSCCSPQSRSPCAVGTQQLTSAPMRPRVPPRRASWPCNCTVDPSRPVPSDEPSRSEDTPEPQTETLGAKPTSDAASEGRRKGLAVMGELKELVTSSNAELKAALEQFALLQQADWEAKRRHQHDRSTLVNMYDTVSKQVVEVKQQLEGALSSRNSTDELLRQVLGAVEKLQEAQQRLDSRTAEAVQHAMAAAASAEAVQQQVDSRTAEAVQHAKAAAASAAAVQRQQGALADEIKAMVGAAAAALAAANQQGAIREAVTAASEASSTALGQGAGGKEGTAGQQQQQPQPLSWEQVYDTAEVEAGEQVTKAMRNNALQAAALAIDKGMAPSDVAQSIRDWLDSKYGKFWQCVVVQGGASGTATWQGHGLIRIVVGDWTMYVWQEARWRM